MREKIKEWLKLEVCKLLEKAVVCCVWFKQLSELWWHCIYRVHLHGLSHPVNTSLSLTGEGLLALL